MVFTGAGKGKPTATMGMARRCIGHGMKVAVVQFIKGAIDTAEGRALKFCDDRVTFLRMEKGTHGKLKIVSGIPRSLNRPGP